MKNESGEKLTIIGSDVNATVGEIRLGGEPIVTW